MKLREREQMREMNPIACQINYYRIMTGVYISI